MTSATHIRTGALLHRAELQAKVTTEDDGGGRDVDWVTERKLWCRIRPLSGAQRLRAMRMESSVTHEIYARYQADVDPSELPPFYMLGKKENFQTQLNW